MKPRSALWPSMATGTTWWPSASAERTALRIASPSASGPASQNRCRTPQPTEGTRGEGMWPRVVLWPSAASRRAAPLPPGVAEETGDRQHDPEHARAGGDEHHQEHDQGHGDRQTAPDVRDRKSTSELQSLMRISYAVFCW